MRNFLPYLFALIILTGCKTQDYTDGKPAICEVHHVQMRRTIVPIGYGLIMPDDKARMRYAASTNSFPNAQTFVGGGAV